MKWPTEKQRYEIVYGYYRDWFASCEGKQASDHDLGQHLCEQLDDKMVKQIVSDYLEQYNKDNDA